MTTFRKLAISMLVLMSMLWLASAALAQSPAAGDAVKVPSTQTAPTSYSLPPDKLARATTLYHIELTMFGLGTVYHFAVLAALLGFGIVVRFRRLAERVTPRFFFQTLIVLPMTFALMRVLALPFNIYGHHIGLAYGFSVQGWMSWFGDWAKATGIEMLVATFLGYGIYLMMRRSPRLWWVWIWIISIPLTVLAVWIVPIVLDPVFNKFAPLEKTNPQLVVELSRVAHRGGLDIPPERMFEMKASEKVTTYNAYVTGIGSSKRIVVWDNTEREMSTPETLFIFGHELGHYVLDHIWKGIAASAFVSLFGIWLGKTFLVGAFRNGPRWGIRGFDDLASLPMLLLITSLLTFVSMPLDSTISRYFEHQADVYGLEITHGINADSPEVAASSFQKLGEKSLDYPSPNGAYVFWTYSHPTIYDRLRFALSYRPWDEGKASHFVK